MHSDAEASFSLRDDCPCFDCKINRYIAFLWSVDYIWEYINKGKE